MADSRQDRLEGILLGLLPMDGSKVPNGQLRPRRVSAAAQAGETIAEADFDPLREAMLAAGLVVKGPRRGGATGRAAATGADDFELQTSAAPVPEAAAPRSAADEPAQVISYRHSDRRRNNPEVGLVNEASDPQQPQKTWAYNPHMDPVLKFNIRKFTSQAVNFLD